MNSVHNSALAAEHSETHHENRAWFERESIPGTFTRWLQSPCTHFWSAALPTVPSSLGEKFKAELCNLWDGDHQSTHYIDVIMTTVVSQITSLTQSFIQAQIKENIKAPRHWPLCEEFTGTGEFPAQRASNAENGSVWWRHHAGGLKEVWELYLALNRYIT